MAERDPASMLRSLVVKDGVGLGGLTADQRALALAVVWAGLPMSVMTEREVNAALIGLLGGAAAFIDTDHVELRRWLVDSGWLARDGYGREYRRVAPPALPASSAELAQALPGPDLPAWVTGTRTEHRQRRDARRQAFTAGKGAA